MTADKLQPLKAQDVLDRMAKAYAGCKSYHDSGVVKTLFVSADPHRPDAKPYTTEKPFKKSP